MGHNRAENAYFLFPAVDVDLPAFGFFSGPLDY
jgi:hypothetical protein